MPRVSVILPAFNCEVALPEALASVQAQSYTDWEAIVCDDGSTDGTAAVVKGFDGKIRLVRSRSNLGPAGARNVAIEEADGELLAFLDADDRWLPEYLAEQVALYDRADSGRGDVGIVACDALVEGPGGREAGTYRDRVPFPERLTLARLLVANPIFSGALAPRSVVRRARGFSTECHGTEDHDLWIRILELGYRAVPNPRVLAIYQVAQGSLSGDAGRMARNTQTVYRRALRRGQLGRRERWIARRELRVQRLVARIAQLRAERAERGRVAWRSLLRTGPLAAVVTIQNPQRWPRVARRLRSGRGRLGDRLAPGREFNLG